MYDKTKMSDNQKIDADASSYARACASFANDSTLSNEAYCKVKESILAGNIDPRQVSLMSCQIGEDQADDAVKLITSSLEVSKTLSAFADTLAMAYSSNLHGRHRGAVFMAFVVAMSAFA